MPQIHTRTLRELLRQFNNAGVSIADFLIALMESLINEATRYQQDLLTNFPKILDIALRTSRIEIVQTLDNYFRHRVRWHCVQEMKQLTNIKSGFHLGATTFTTEQLDIFKLGVFVTKYRTVAPNLWDLICAVLQAQPRPNGISPDKILGSDQAILDRHAGALLNFSDDLADWNDDPAESIPPNSTPVTSDGGAETPASKRSRSLDNIERKEAIFCIVSSDTVKTDHSQVNFSNKRAVVILSICMNTANSHCNGFQVLSRLFLESVNAPERTVKWASRAGIGLSPTAGNLMLDSLSRSHMNGIKQFSLFNDVSSVYDNLEFLFSSAEPTKTSGQKMKSVTAHTYVPLYHTPRDSLLCSQFVWERNPVNRLRKEGMSYSPGLMDVILTKQHQARLTERLCWHIRSILVQCHPLFRCFVTKLGLPSPSEDSLRIPVQKTHQFPGRIIDAAESTVSGNAQVLDSIREQGGFAFNEERLISSGKVIITHGDLGTIEKIETLQQSRSIEDDNHSNAVNRYQYVVPLFGLFHVMMAFAESLRRLYLPDPASRLDATSSFKHMTFMRPKESEKFKSNPGFRRLNDALVHELSARILNCWMEIIESKKNMSLEEWAKTNPSWNDICAFSEAIHSSFVATKGFATERDRPLHERDRIFENSQLFLRDCLLYVEHSHAQKYGDIGRVEDTFIPFMWISKATGKHKYASTILKYIANTKGNWPPELIHAVRMNWLCNPSGKVDGFRGQDWMMERNNFVHKHILSGSSSNNTIQLVIKRSPLVCIFREVHEVIERMFHITPGSVAHTRPDMTSTILMLAADMHSRKAHRFVKGRGSSFSVHNGWQEGCDALVSALLDSDQLDEMEETAAVAAAGSGSGQLETQDETEERRVELSAEDFDID